MVHYDASRVWDAEEWDRYINHGRVHCARIGWDLWVEEQHNNFQTSMTIFDDESQWLGRNGNLRPPCELEWTKRRSLLSCLQNQFVRYVALIQHDNNLIQNAVEVINIE